MRLIDLHEEQAQETFRAWEGNVHAAARAVEIEREIRGRCYNVLCASPSGGMVCPPETWDLTIPRFRTNRLLDTGVWQDPTLTYGVPDAERVYPSSWLPEEPCRMPGCGRMLGDCPHAGNAYALYRANGGL